MVGIDKPEALAFFPRIRQVSIGGYAAIIFEQARHVKQVVGHKRDVAVGKVIFWTARFFVEIAWSRPNFAYPAGVSLWRYGETDVLQAVEHIHGAVLYAVLVATDQAAAHFAVVRPLPCCILFRRVSVEAFDDLFCLRAIVAEPDRSGDYHDIGVEYFLVDAFGPGISAPALFAHVWIDACGNVVIDGSDDVGADAVLLHE